MSRALLPTTLSRLGLRWEQKALSHLAHVWFPSEDLSYGERLEEGHKRFYPDAVLRRPSYTLVFEVKRASTLRALPQLTTYVRLLGPFARGVVVVRHHQPLGPTLRYVGSQSELDAWATGDDDRYALIVLRDI